MTRLRCGLFIIVALAILGMTTPLAAQWLKYPSGPLGGRHACRGELRIQ